MENKDQEHQAKIINLKQHENPSLEDIMPQIKTLMNSPTKENPDLQQQTIYQEDVVHQL